MNKYVSLIFVFLMAYMAVLANSVQLAPDDDLYSLTWHTQSTNSSESMPCGGGEIGLNVWAENGDILFYIARSSAFDENNALLKLGRVRLHLSDANFGKVFSQKLSLKDGSVTIRGANNMVVRFWVDVFHPVVHIDISADKAQHAKVTYENWRYKDYALSGEDAHLCGMKGTKDSIYIRPDNVAYADNQILFYHRNRNDFIFQRTVECEELQDIKDKLWNPVKNRTFGGLIQGTGLVAADTGSGRYADTDYKYWSLATKEPRKKLSITVTTNIEQTATLDEWRLNLNKIQKRQLASTEADRKASIRWWNSYWKRSYINMYSDTDPKAREIARNYQLFRYMLGCNAYGDTPTKFNGSLFTFDPCYVKGNKHLSPDFRQWGGASMTAQNQRLVYWPMLKTGDWDMMDSQFNYYLRMMHNAELMTESYWGHKGACFTEQIENFGLPVAYSYGMEPRTGLRTRGKQANAYCEYLWDTVMDFCLMMIRTNTYEGRDITPYIPFIESCLTFFDEHYRMLALQRTVQPFDRKKHYIFYPGTAGETYKMATNSSQTIAALTTVLNEFILLPDKYLSKEKKAHWQEMLSHMPPIPFRTMEGHKVIAPAQSFERLMNVEINQLYPVFPYDMYGLGRPDLEVARDTWRYGIDQPKWQKNRHESWHQDAIFCARLGLLAEARDLVWRKWQNGRHRFPAFFGPGHDWTPDHNWGGTGMIALQEMLMQNVGDSILILPCWPKEWNVSFKLHAPKQTTVECTYRNGKIEKLSVFPESRRKDIICMLNDKATPDTLTALRSQPINDNWEFAFENEQVRHVSLPHTWNDKDAQENILDKNASKATQTYKRGKGIYSRSLLIPSEWKDKKRIFVWFGAASQVANVYVNNKFVGEHKGAFTAFCIELTNDIKYGEENILRVETDNRWRADLAPLSGGFAIMGGLYRGVELIVTDKLCISPLFYASNGVFVDTENNGNINIKVHLNYAKYSDGKMTTTIPHTPAMVEADIYDAAGKLVGRSCKTLDCISGDDTVAELTTHIDNPILWNGKDNPYLYKANVRIKANGCADEVGESFGFRKIALDKEQGFLLNGKAYPVYGVARHQDMKDKGWALNHNDNLRDMQIINEVGATAIRMAHYPQSNDIHNIADSMGILVWDEVPLVNEVRNSEAFNDNARNMMLEMIFQLYNHPSVCWWGLFNEIDYPETSASYTIFNQLNDLAHKYGGNRLTTSASNKGKRYYNGIADAPAWNNYPGWYWMLRWPKEESNKGRMDGFGEWIDYRSEELEGRRFALSEYGAGANPEHHIEVLPEQLMETWNGPFHPEEWQSHVHEEAWRTIKQHGRQLWGSFVWAMFDFIVPGWNEGGINNLCNKGLVTADRKIRKDAFFFYKANWIKEPMVYICSRRMEKHKCENQKVRVYSNCDKVELLINGKKSATAIPDEINVCSFENVKLKEGVNKISVCGYKGGKKVADSCSFLFTP